jgi:hypothetical protein
MTILQPDLHATATVALATIAFAKYILETHPPKETRTDEILDINKPAVPTTGQYNSR